MFQFHLRNLLNLLVGYHYDSFLNSETKLKISGWCCKSFDLVLVGENSVKTGLYRKDLNELLGSDFADCGFEINLSVNKKLSISLKEKNRGIQKIALINGLSSLKDEHFLQDTFNERYPNCSIHENKNSCGYIDSITYSTNRSFFKLLSIFYRPTFRLLSDANNLSLINLQKLICILHSHLSYEGHNELFSKSILHLPELQNILNDKAYSCPLCLSLIHIDTSGFFNIELLDIAKETRDEVLLKKDINNFEFVEKSRNFFEVKRLGNFELERTLKAGFCVIKDVQIFSPDILIKNHSLLEHDFSAAPFRGFIADRHTKLMGVRNNFTHCYVRNTQDIEVETIDEGFLLTGRSSHNWFHALFEYMPRLLYYQKLNNIPLLVSSEINPRVKEVLDIFDVSKNIKFLFPHKSYRVRNLVVPKSVGFITDDPDLDWKDSNNLNINLIKQFYSELKSRVPTNNFSSDKVYAVRNSSIRNILNYEDVDYIAQKFGYIKIDFAKLTLADQINLMRNVTHVIAPAGAFMANFPFLQKGAKVLSIISKHNQKALILPTIASVFGLNFFQFLGKSSYWDILKSNSNSERIHLSYRVNMRDFDKSVGHFTKTII
jgi:hypothetical protein